MAGFLVFWSQEQLRRLEKAGDTGPVKVVYGSHHTKMPAITKVREGDILYITALKKGDLVAVARLPVERVEPAFHYLMRETGWRHDALCPEGVAVREGNWYIAKDHIFRDAAELPEGTEIYDFSERSDLPHAAHQEPQTCCAALAASGSKGSLFGERPIPADWLPEMRFGASKSKEKPLKPNAKGVFTSFAFAGYVRRMSEDTQARFESLFAE